MKRTALYAALLAAMSLPAVAAPTPLNKAQLDQVVAGDNNNTNNSNNPPVTATGGANTNNANNNPPVTAQH